MPGGRRTTLPLPSLLTIASCPASTAIRHQTSSVFVRLARQRTNPTGSRDVVFRLCVLARVPPREPPREFGGAFEALYVFLAVTLSVSVTYFCAHNPTHIMYHIYTHSVYTHTNATDRVCVCVHIQSTAYNNTVFCIAYAKVFVRHAFFCMMWCT